VDLPLDHVVVRSPDGLAHARVRDVPVLLCGRAVPDGSREEPAAADVTCPECLREASLRDDRSVGVVDA
jgi:hypothetical protein